MFHVKHSIRMMFGSLRLISTRTASYETKQTAGPEEQTACLVWGVKEKDMGCMIKSFRSFIRNFNVICFRDPDPVFNEAFRIRFFINGGDPAGMHP